MATRKSKIHGRRIGPKNLDGGKFPKSISFTVSDLDKVEDLKKIFPGYRDSNVVMKALDAFHSAAMRAMLPGLSGLPSYSVERFFPLFALQCSRHELYELGGFVLPVDVPDTSEGLDLLAKLSKKFVDRLAKQYDAGERARAVVDSYLISYQLLLRDPPEEWTAFTQFAITQRDRIPFHTDDWKTIYICTELRAICTLAEVLNGSLVPIIRILDLRTFLQSPRFSLRRPGHPIFIRPQTPSRERCRRTTGV